MKKTIILTTVLLITPLTTYAVWWNPFTWFERPIVIETPIELQANTFATTSVATTTIEVEVKEEKEEVDNETLIQAEVEKRVQAELRAKAAKQAEVARQKALEEKKKADLADAMRKAELAKKEADLLQIQNKILETTKKEIQALEKQNELLSSFLPSANKEPELVVNEDICSNGGEDVELHINGEYIKPATVQFKGYTDTERKVDEMLSFDKNDDAFIKNNPQDGTYYLKASLMYYVDTSEKKVKKIEESFKIRVRECE